SLHLLNSAEMQGKLATASGRAAQLAASETPVEERVTQLYMAAFARPPQPDELQTAVEYINTPPVDSEGKPVEGPPAVQQNARDLVWALINTKEFLFNH